MKKYIFTVIGQDCPGIVASVSKTLTQYNCNIENISQTTLQSQFAGLFIAVIPDNVHPKTVHAQMEKNVSLLKLNVFLKEIKTNEPQPQFNACEPFIITTIGPDRLGLVAAVTEILAEFKANITNLKAVFKGGNDPKNNVMIYEVEIPCGIEQQQLKQKLRDKAKELDLDISIQHRYIFEAINTI